MVDNSSQQSVWAELQSLLQSGVSSDHIKGYLQSVSLPLDDFRPIPEFCKRFDETDAYDMVCVGGDAVANMIANGTIALGGRALIVGQRMPENRVKLLTLSSIANKVH